MKVALVCDWLTNVGGAERVLLSLHELYPEAPIYTSQYSKKGIDWFKDADVRTGWMQILPSSLRRFFGPLRQLYFNHLDLSEYDVIISVTGAEAKSVKFNPQTTTHLCYCHVPTQYYWQMYDDYIKNPGFGILNPLVRGALKLFLKPLKRADYKAAQRPTAFITISSYAANLIKKYYNRESQIVNPPVAVENFCTIEKGKCQIKNRTGGAASGDPQNASRSEDFGGCAATGPVQYFVSTPRQVTWKRLDLCIKACLKTKQPLYIIGEGPEHKNLEKLAAGSSLIHFLPRLTQAELVPWLQNAKGYLFPSLEPFGIAPVEALAAGCPVIAYADGGSRDFIKDGINGIFFENQSVASLAAAIERFNSLTFDPAKIAQTAQPFSDARFKQEIQDVVKKAR